MSGAEESRALYLFLDGIALGSLLLVLAQPPFGQDLGDHDFADQRVFPDLPNFFHLVTSLGFVIIGAAGVRLCRCCQPGVLLMLQRRSRAG